MEVAKKKKKKITFHLKFAKQQPDIAEYYQKNVLCPDETQVKLFWKNIQHHEGCKKGTAHQHENIITMVKYSGGQ